MNEAVCVGKIIECWLNHELVVKPDWMGPVTMKTGMLEFTPDKKYVRVGSCNWSITVDRQMGEWVECSRIEVLYVIKENKLNEPLKPLVDQVEEFKREFEAIGSPYCEGLVIHGCGVAREFGFCDPVSWPVAWVVFALGVGWVCAAIMLLLTVIGVLRWSVVG